MACLHPHAFILYVKQGTKYRYLRIYRYLDFTEISEISENIGGYFDKNIGNAKIYKNTLKFMKILC